MRILVLGGAGHMGAAVVSELIKRSDAKITVGDVNAKALDRIASEFGKRVDTSIVNADDFGSLAQLMKKADVVISTIGPYYKYAVKLLKASIAAGVNFVDIDDDYDATRESFSLDGEAKKAGITAVIGCGASPGVTNMSAKYGADKLDRVDEIRIFWAESATDPAGPAAMIHWFHITSGDVPMFKDGNWVNVKGLSEPEIVDFLPPLGKLQVCYTGHSEPVSLPRYIKGVKDVTIKGSIFPIRMLEVYKTLTEVGFGSADDFIVTQDTSMPLRELTVKVVRAMPRFAPGFFQELYEEEKEKYAGCAGAMKIKVSGEKAGEKVQYIYDLISDSVRGGTATPAAVGALMILNGKVKATGVLAPEGALDPVMFFSELKARIRETEIKEREIG